MVSGSFGYHLDTYRDEHDVRYLLNNGWITFYEAYEDLLNDINFSKMIKNIFEACLYEHMTKKFMWEMSEKIYHTILEYTGREPEYEIIVGYYPENKSDVFVMCRKKYRL